MNNVIVIRIQRSAVGITIPFDKLYFFRREDRDLIPSIFKYALVLPVDPTLMTALYTLRPNHVSHLKKQRDDKTQRVATGISGRQVSNAAVTTWWDNNIVKKYDLTERVAVVPILTSKVRKKRKPRYLSARLKTGSGEKRLPISELAYLATPEAPPDDKIQPLCTICPRMLLHMQGDCSPGQLACYKALDFNRIVLPEVTQ